ncbi:MAG: hypothetical protein AB7G44_02880 [Bacteroidia bacterium]
MSKEKSNIDAILELDSIKNDEKGINKYEKLGLKFNPFPRSGTANMNSNDSYTESLIPVSKNTISKVAEYIRGALVPNILEPNNKLATGVIIGNYGMGKTQLMLYIKSLLSQLYKSENPLINSKRPYVIYIDNPGVSISELIGSIIRNIGEENFRKFLWKNIIERIEKEDKYKERLNRFKRIGSISMFENERNSDPFHETNNVNYKLFIDAFIGRLNVPRDRKAFDNEMKQIITEILQYEFKDAVLAEYFYDIVSSDLGVNTTWEAFITGSGKYLEGKESGIIKVIFEIVREQGFTHFFVLVDEFEDISQGRLTKIKLDNYLYNLRILVDEHREWCLLFAMIPDALRQIKKISVPLAQRISAITIELDKLSEEDTILMVNNYLELARLKINKNNGNNIHPFTLQSIKHLSLKAEIDRTPRSLLQACFSLIEKAADKGKDVIDEKFIDESIIS